MDMLKSKRCRDFLMFSGEKIPAENSHIFGFPIDTAKKICYNKNGLVSPA